MRRAAGVATLALAALAGSLLLTGCGRLGRACARLSPYLPQSRDITLTMLPDLVHEQEREFPFLKKAFANGGVLEGHEVYSFMPSTIAAVAGDTLRLTLVNPEDDDHTIVLPGLALALPGGKTTHAVYVAKEPGVYPITCSLPTHRPMMWGQLIVLSPLAVGHAPAGDGGRYSFAKASG